MQPGRVHPGRLLYSNFTSLDELLLALWERTVETTTAAIRVQVATMDDRDEPFETAMPPWSPCGRRTGPGS